MADQPSITHHACGMTSYNPNDITQRYCGNCHVRMEEGEYTITEPDLKEIPVGITFWVNGVVARRDGNPYIQLSNDKGLIGQFTMAQARQVANDIVESCARTEADALILKFFKENLNAPEEAYAAAMQLFRDFRAELDKKADAERLE